MPEVSACSKITRGEGLNSLRKISSQKVHLPCADFEQKAELTLAVMTPVDEIHQQGLHDSDQAFSLTIFMLLFERSA